MLFLKSSTKTCITFVVTNDRLKANNADAEHLATLRLFSVRCKDSTETRCPVFEHFVPQLE